MRYTGQRYEDGLAGGLYDYRSRWYDPALGRFIQPDTIVPEPGNPQSLNRYTYVLNNALRYTDPTGHREEEGDGMVYCEGYLNVCTYPVGHPYAGYPLGHEPITAIGMGVSIHVSVDTPIASGSAGIALEGLESVTTHEQALFAVPEIALGGGVPRGGFKSTFRKMMKDPSSLKAPFNVHASGYLIVARNTDHPEGIAAGYFGRVTSNTTTVAGGFGLTAGESHVPGDALREGPHAQILGPAAGTALQTDKTLGYAIPLVSRQPEEANPTFYNPQPYVSETIQLFRGIISDFLGWFH